MKLWMTVILASAFVLPLFVYAQESSTTTTSEETTQVPIATQEEVRVGLSLEKQTRIKNLTANISNKLEAVSSRLQAITKRIERRMNKMEQEGFSIAEARTRLDEAKTELTHASAVLKDIDIRIAEVISSEKPNEKWNDVREIYRETFFALASAKQLLRETIALLKNAPLKTTAETATSTTSTDTETP